MLNSAAEADSVGVQSVEPKSTINKVDARSRKVSCLYELLGRQTGDSGVSIPSQEDRMMAKDKSTRGVS